MTTDTAALTRAVADAHARLLTAESDRRPCAPVRRLLPPDDLAAAYAVQSATIAGKLRAGARIVGRKIGLTNPAVQRQLGVDQPDFGVLLDRMNCPPGVLIDITRSLQPRIEAEIAFVLGADLDRPAIDISDVVAATEHIRAALEIVDSRIAGWDITIVDTVADNASSGLFVIGDAARPLGDIELTDCTMALHRGDELVSTGTGADCLGNPLAAVAWLANTARDYGHPLRAGEVILSGALGPVVPVRPGDVFTATISDIGSVSAPFSSLAASPDQARA